MKRSDTVLFYHAPFYLSLLNFVHRIKGFRLVAEVEEIYAAAEEKDAVAQNREISALKQADAFYLVNDLMAERCGFQEKAYWVSYGNYYIPEKERKDFGDGRIHAVYAGVVEEIKRGAFIAVATAEFLPENYCIDILGFGAPRNISALQSEIARINQKKGYEAVVFHGAMYGEAYRDFLSRCTFGLSTHTSEGDFVDLSFPSKLLIYIGHNVIPVCAEIPCVKKSSIASAVRFYGENTPQAVAEALLQKPPEAVVIKDMLKALDQQMIDNASYILKKNNEAD